MLEFDDIDDEWEFFMESGKCVDNIQKEKNVSYIPKCGDIYISTKTKIVYLNKSIDLFDIFWKLDIIDYQTMSNGIIKKQIKINSKCQEEVDNIEYNLSKYKYTNSYIINSINNPDGRVKFKDVRKVSIGLCKRDLINYRTKQKGAFYNCFVIILRIKIDEKYNEYHVKVFNTGKLEIPGIKNDNELNIILENVLSNLKTHILDLNTTDNMETVLINSNFDCGFYLDRNKLFNILKTKYNIQSVFDPCSYPGIQCRIFFNKSDELSKEYSLSYGKVSFMIFRTGSVLIVGKCNMEVLFKIYEYIKDILHSEFREIYEMDKVKVEKNMTKKKIKKKIQIIQ